ncbi:DUF899 domain-containing protein [Chitinophaga japonensis]|nr:thioredoxin family protein [Chitinophaga japonensis]
MHTTIPAATDRQQHTVVSAEEWASARRRLLEKEKAFTRLRDELNRERLELPWERVEKTYRFEGPRGTETLADLFDGRSQLMVYHFMFGPGWEEGCPSCSFLTDHIDGTLVHLANRDITLLLVSRAPLGQIEAFKKRMGWQVKWVSSYGSDFNYDYQVSFREEDKAKGQVYYNYGPAEFIAEDLHGLSVFYKNGQGEVFHTYSTYGRGCDMLVGTYNYMDLAPKGRDEDQLNFTMSWVRHHDRYDQQYTVDPAAAYQPPKATGSCCHGEGGDS